jgi:hypothetical protein
MGVELGAALNGRISADLLLANERDPGKLARAFRDAHPLKAGQLSEAEVVPRLPTSLPWPHSRASRCTSLKSKTAEILAQADSTRLATQVPG